MNYVKSDHVSVPNRIIIYIIYFKNISILEIVIFYATDTIEVNKTFIWIIVIIIIYKKLKQQ